MNIFAALFAACAIFALLGCGGGDSTTAPQQDPRFAIVTGIERGARPQIDAPNRPPPKKPLVRDLELGSGPAAQAGDQVAVHYVGVDYETGELVYFGIWPPDPPRVFQLGSGGLGEAWEEGIVGMKAGGRRELIIPSHLHYGTGTIDYVVGLAGIEPDPD